MNDGTFIIEDPDCSETKTRPLKRLNFAGYNPGYSIIIKAERLEPFYEKSEKIKDSQAILRSLNHLRHCNSELPEGLEGLICKEFPEIQEGEETLTLDKAMAHYQALDAQNSPRIVDNMCCLC